MKLLKNTKFAAVVAGVVCVASMFLGTNRSFARDLKALDTQFHEGMPSRDGSYTQPSIASQIDACNDYSLGIYTFAVNYSRNEDVKLWRSRMAMVRDWQRYNEGLKTTYSGDYHSIIETSEQLYAALQNVEMLERDEQAIEAYYNDLMGAKTLIESLVVEYNAEITKLYNISESFPARIFRSDTTVFNIHHSAFAPASDFQWDENGLGTTYNYEGIFN